MSPSLVFAFGCWVKVSEFLWKAGLVVWQLELHLCFAAGLQYIMLFLQSRPHSPICLGA